VGRAWCLLDTNHACRNEKERSIELTLVVLTLSRGLARLYLQSDHALEFPLNMKCLESMSEFRGTCAIRNRDDQSQPSVDVSAKRVQS